LDPPRGDTEETIHRAYALGVDVKMITGDQLLVARETARQLSMGTNILEPHGLPDFTVGDPIPKDLGTKYGELCYEADGFAQARRFARLSLRLCKTVVTGWAQPHATR
jgi:H+-transporting ATPase